MAGAKPGHDEQGEGMRRLRTWFVLDKWGIAIYIAVFAVWGRALVAAFNQNFAFEFGQSQHHEVAARR